MRCLFLILVCARSLYLLAKLLTRQIPMQRILANEACIPKREKIYVFIIKFPYNARSDWLKQRPLSENKVQVNDIKLAFKFLLRNFDKFDPN